MKRRNGFCMVALLSLGLPALDFYLVMRIVYIATVPDLLSPLVAIIIGFFLAIIVCVVCIAGQGRTLIEVIVPSLILLVFLIIIYPVALKLPQKRRANLQKRTIQQRGYNPLATPQSNSKPQ